MQKLRTFTFKITEKNHKGHDKRRRGPQKILVKKYAKRSEFRVKFSNQLSFSHLARKTFFNLYGYTVYCRPYTGDPLGNKNRIFAEI